MPLREAMASCLRKCTISIRPFVSCDDGTGLPLGEASLVLSLLLESVFPRHQGKAASYLKQCTILSSVCLSVSEIAESLGGVRFTFGTLRNVIVPLIQLDIALPSMMSFVSLTGLGISLREPASCFRILRFRHFFCVIVRCRLARKEAGLILEKTQNDIFIATRSDFTVHSGVETASYFKQCTIIHFIRLAVFEIAAPRTEDSPFRTIQNHIYIFRLSHCISDRRAVERRQLVT